MGNRVLVVGGASLAGSVFAEMLAMDRLRVRDEPIVIVVDHPDRRSVRDRESSDAPAFQPQEGERLIGDPRMLEIFGQEVTRGEMEIKAAAEAKRARRARKRLRDAGMLP